MSAIREQLVKLLTWEDAHVGFDAAVTGIPPELRGAAPPGLLAASARSTSPGSNDSCVRVHPDTAPATTSANHGWR